MVVLGCSAGEAKYLPSVVLGDVERGTRSSSEEMLRVVMLALAPSTKARRSNDDPMSTSKPFVATICKSWE